MLLVVVLLPWSFRRWRTLAVELGPKWRNPAFAPPPPGRPGIRKRHLDRHQRLSPDRRPAALPEAERPTLLASPLWTGFAWRRRGKLEVVEAALGADRLATATVVTDNDEDGDLLAAARTTLYLKWPAARFEPAHAEAYLLFF